MDFELKNEGSNSFEEEPFESNDEVKLQTPTLRRSNRLRRPVERYTPHSLCSNFSLSSINDEPRSIKEAIRFEDCIFWKKGMVQEMEALVKNEASDLVELPHGRRLVGSKWVLKEKLNLAGKDEKYKD